MGRTEIKDRNEVKKLFFIAATDKIGSLNRIFLDVMCGLLNSDEYFIESYRIETHIEKNCENLYDSLDSVIQGDEYEGYVVLLDALDDAFGLCNPNVMFEFGAIKNLGKPFTVMATRTREQGRYPFDVDNLNVTIVPSCIIEYAKEVHDSAGTVKLLEWKDKLVPRKMQDIKNFCYRLYSNYTNSLERHKRSEKRLLSVMDRLDMIVELNQLLKSSVDKFELKVQNTAEYIPGERAAFKALKEAVETAQNTLRTSRFANQSIVSTPTPEQQQFMDALYTKSVQLKKDFTRIICNNNPTKWFDIYNILYYGGNGSRVYVRKSEYSIHFELVVIDETVAFLHFYQADTASGNGIASGEFAVEKINSTLKISGNGVCSRLAGIFDRLHHRDFMNSNPTDPSRTLIGMPRVDLDGFDGAGIGYFELPYNCTLMESVRGRIIIDKFKNAFVTWTQMESKDKINMAVGIALLEGNEEWLNQMKADGKLSPEAYDKAFRMYREQADLA